MQIEAPIYRQRDRGPHAELIHDLRIWPIQTTRSVAYDIPEVYYEPVNTAAEKIVHYRQTFERYPWLPESPWLEEHGRYFLPAAQDELLQNSRINPPQAKHWPWSILDAPVYRVTKSLSFGSLHHFHPGEVRHLGWPQHEWELVPVSDSAKEIANYFAKNFKNRDLLPAPFDFLTGDLFLPKLDKARAAA